MSNLIEVEEDIILYAFRYALGRQSYSVSDVAEIIVKNKDKLSIMSKNIIIKEINELFERHDGLVFPIDDVWKIVLKELE
jgi:hypothetical protein